MSNRSWDLYRTFLVVLEQGSLSGAARALGLTQPTVGRHVEALEEELGAQLFLRSPQGLAPTETAVALRPYAEALSATVAALERAATAAADRVEGTVRITASEVMGVEVLPPILAAIAERHPALELELSLSDSVADLLRREADVAVRMTRPEQAALVVRRIGTIPVGLHARRDYLEAHGVPASMADLRAHRLIGFDVETPTIRSMRRRIPDFDAPFAVRADSQVAQLSLVRAGAGIGFAQCPLAERAGLVRVLPDFRFDMETWLAMHENLRSTPSCRAVFDGLAEGLAAYVTGARGPG